MGEFIDNDSYKMTFGQYRGKSISEIIEINPGYITWLAETVGMDFDHKILYQAEQGVRFEDAEATWFNGGQNIE